jgi:hypothetical protein
MHFHRVWLAGALLLSAALAGRGEVTVAMERSPDGADLAYKTVPAPRLNDAAATAAFTLVAGGGDPNAGPLAVLHDGRLPTEEDQPAENFFFRAGTDGGRLRIDLGSLVTVQQVNTYSWHAGTRAPQVYQLYASAGVGAGFVAAPPRGTDPAAGGWQRVAAVDTRPKDSDGGGQYAVAVTDPAAGVLGEYRYLLFDISPTEDRDAFGNTFYSEIDVLDAHGPPAKFAPTGEGERRLKSFVAQGGQYRFTLDATAAPDLLEWADTQLRPVLQEWYPRLVAMLPSAGFRPATNITLRFRTDMGGTPASTSGGRLHLNSGWFRRELNGEARGSVVHELVHVVQDYGRVRHPGPGATRTPGWLVEGIADYVRWFCYEPEKKGAEITERNLARANYDASYRTTANFLNWVTQSQDPEIVRKLNAAAREGNYSEQLWQDWTGKTAPELGAAWKLANEERLHAAKAKASPTKPAPSGQ